MINSKTIFAFVVLAIVAQGALTLAQTPTPSDVHVKLVLADNKSTFRIGDPIVLFMEFSADVDGYTVDMLPDRKEPGTDNVSISPDTGFTHWLDEMTGKSQLGRHVFSTVKLSKTPTRVSLALNDTLRFERAGRYKVKVATRRVAPASSTMEHLPPILLTTNEVAFEIIPMSEEEEKKEIKRLSELLSAKRDWQMEERVTAELSYLTGDASSREKVRRFLNPEERSGNYFAHIMYGLYIARNRPLVLRLLETGMRDPNQPVESSLLSVVSQLRFLRETEGAPIETRVGGVTHIANANPRFAEIQNEYIAELAATLNKRSGKSLTTTAMTILSATKKGSENAALLTREARRVLIQHFDSLHPFSQEYLLRMFWDELRDVALVGSLKKMLVYSSTSSKNVHDSALKRLIELAPEEARPYVIEQIRNPASLVELEILGSLSDKSLPEVDNSLLEQIRGLAGSKRSFDQIYFKHKASLAARYATENIYQEMLKLYREVGVKLPLESRAVLLAYLAKQNETEAIPLIEEALEEVPPEQVFNFLPKLTVLYYSEGIGTVVKKRLDASDPQAASNAAYLIGKHGTAADKSVLEARLERWRQEWGERQMEADANLQGMVERELVYALLHGQSWKLTDERAKELKQSCVTKMCQQSNRN